MNSPMISEAKSSKKSISIGKAHLYFNHCSRSKIYIPTYFYKIFAVSETGEECMFQQCLRHLEGFYWVFSNIVGLPQSLKHQSFKNKPMVCLTVKGQQITDLKNCLVWLLLFASAVSRTPCRKQFRIWITQSKFNTYLNRQREVTCNGTIRICCSLKKKKTLKLSWHCTVKELFKIHTFPYKGSFCHVHYINFASL
jgi:hypothetical protein